MAIDPRMDVFNKTEILSRLTLTSFRQPPAPPIHKNILKTYPSIVPQKKFNWTLWLIPFFIFVIVFLVSLSVIMINVSTQRFNVFAKSLAAYKSNVLTSSLTIPIVLTVFCFISAVVWIPFCFVISKRKKKRILKE